MGVEFKIKIRSADDTPIDVSGNISDEEKIIFDTFLLQCDRLNECKPMQEGVPCSITIKGGVNQPVEASVQLPTDDDTSILLHRLRPLILETEPASFIRTKAVLGKIVTHPDIRALLRKQQELYDGREFQAQVKFASNEQILNCEQTLKDWLNSYEYHRDTAKRATIEELFDKTPGDLLKGILVSLVIDKIKAIDALARLTRVLLGKMEEVRFVRTA